MEPKWTFDDIMGETTKEQRLADKIAKKIARARARREDEELNRAMRDLSLYDQNEPMDIDATRGIPIELV